jgi:hypothetical protein
MVPGAIFTTFNSLHNLLIDPKVSLVVPDKPFQPKVIKQSTLLGAILKL